MKQLIWMALLSAFVISAQAQTQRWQQRVEYTMDVDFDLSKHQFTGTQRLVYHNNSPDYLDRAYWHLYFNAFQPGSMMDVRSRTLPDPDRRVGDRISKLKPEEEGHLHVRSLTMNGRPVQYEEAGTILEAQLPEPIAPGQSVVFEMEFWGQVPLQIRRSGRDNAEGIAYSMSQWYPKLCEYDYQGWHPEPYIGREFYGVWGDFDVTIHIDKDYIIGATGVLQNPEQIGYGYLPEGQQPQRPAGDKLTWHFKAENVHDFVWAADPDYKHVTRTRKDGTVLHFFYQENERTRENWARLPEIMDRAFDFINAHYGQYPYPQYSFIQGGDGGMEYPMATLITGERNLGSLVGVSVHELMHSWYQGVLATNESLYAWMDEGFTSYASAEVMNWLRREGILPGEPADNPHLGDYQTYTRFALSGQEEPLCTHADHFQTNRAYGIGSYVKGAIFLHQLQYIVGKEAFDRIMLDYFDTWKFRHPNDEDFLRIAEKNSKMVLDWYLQYWIHSTHTIDYGIKEVAPSGKKQVTVTLERVGKMPMPVDVVITYRKGRKELVTIPLRIMRGAKPQEFADMDFRVADDWPWVNPTYELVLEGVKLKHVERIEIDPSRRLADVNLLNNVWEKPDRKK